MYPHKQPRIVFFGTPDIAVAALSALEKAGLTPELIVTNQDRPQGRAHKLTPSPVKLWALEHHIKVLQPFTLISDEIAHKLTECNADLFVVVAYGALIPNTLLSIPTHGAINMHPSLLPKLRGPSPIRSAILSDIRETGVSIMVMDKEMDHGPILAQQRIDIKESDWPLPGRVLDRQLAELGGALLADTIPKWCAGTITPVEQNHAAATYTKKITKEMGELTLDPYNLPGGTEAYIMLCKIRAFDGWPGTFFFYNDMRIKILGAELTNSGTLLITRIIPEGKREMEFKAFFNLK